MKWLQSWDEIKIGPYIIDNLVRVFFASFGSAFPKPLINEGIPQEGPHPKIVTFIFSPRQNLNHRN